MNPAVLADLIALGGTGLCVVELDGDRSPARSGAVRVGAHRAGPLQTDGLEDFDILLSADPAAPRPWVGVADVQTALEVLEARIAANSTAATVAAQVFRMTLRLDFDQALALESLAYSTLLASDGFRTWLAANAPRRRAEPDSPRVVIGDEGGVIQIELNRPKARNAFDARMRDELCEALAFALDHPDSPPAVLSGRGASFSTGGDLTEFGSAADVGEAHLIRGLRSPARLVHRLGKRITARVHGPCIGAGIEVPAAAGRVVAKPGTWFRLPEVSMGLIPGAGGTTTIARRIGRRRACYMAISGADIDARTALAWGLVDEIAG